MNVDFYYAGENSRQTYEYAVPVLKAAAEAMSKRSPRFDWNAATNTLKVLVVTPADIDPDKKYKKLDWSVIPTCGSSLTRAEIDINTYITDASNKFYKLLRASVRSGYIPEPLFNDVVLTSPNGISSLNGIVASSAMPQVAGVINIGREVPELGLNYIVLTMPDEPPKVEETANSLSGLEMRFLKNIKGSARDWSLATLGHEVAGHGLHGHTVPHSSAYSCTGIDYDLLDHTANHEGQSDIALAETVKAANSLGMMQEADALPSQWAYLRVLGSFFKNHNAFSVGSSSDINAHLTTIHFDPETPDSAAAFDQASAKGISALPILINTYADYIAGYVYAHQKHIAVKARPKSATQYERRAFAKLDGDIMSLDTLIEYGAHARFGKEADEKDSKIISSPAYHVAAMHYLKKSGAFAEIRKNIASTLQPAFDDLISDYFKAVNAHGSNALASAAAQRHFDSAFKGSPMGVSALTSILFSRDIPGMRRADIEQYRKERALDQSVPAFIGK